MIQQNPNRRDPPTDEANIQNRSSISAATSNEVTARYKLPCKMCASACATKNGWRVRKKNNSPFVTGSVSRYSKKPKSSSATVVAPKLQRHRISPNVNEGRRNAARNPSKVGEIRVMHSG